MTQLVKRTEPEQKAFESLTSLQQYYVALKSEKPISELSDQVVKQSCIDIITRGMMFISPNGQPEFKTIQFQTQELYEQVSGPYKSLTLSEVKECFRRGLAGDYGQYFGMCGKSYVQFLKAWFDNGERNKAFQQYLDNINGWRRADKPVIIDKAFFHKACEDAYKDYKVKGVMPTVPFSLYDIVKEYTGLKSLIAQGTGNQIRDEGRKDYTEKIRSSSLKKMAKDWKLDSRPTLKDGSPNPDYNQVYANSIKSVALKYYFDSLIKQGKETIK